MQRDNALNVLYREFNAFALGNNLLFLGEIGSTSHGTASEPIDDYDLMGIVVPPARNLIGLGNWQHWVRSPDEDGFDFVLYSLHKYVSLALKSNPNVIGLLWLDPQHEVKSSLHWDTLRRNRHYFASLHAYNAFVGYAHSQFGKMHAKVYNGYMGQKRKELVDRFGYDTKMASHTIRLLRTGIEFLQTGEITVFRPDREELRAIKKGEWELDRVRKTVEDLFEQAKAAREESVLPEEPEYDKVERLMMEIHRSFL